jgi:hypothetical protein
MTLARTRPADDQGILTGGNEFKGVQFKAGLARQFRVEVRLVANFEYER